MVELEKSVSDDIARIKRISIVPIMLEAVCRITGMGFAAVARVTPERWVTMEVLDKIKFGLLPGSELKVDTTICHEIRQSGSLVVIDHVAEDEFYSMHHTPAMYGFQSYISVPVVRREDSFFGTLCAIDPSPAILNTPAIITLFKTYSALISFHLNALEQLSDQQLAMVQESTSAVLRKHLEELEERNIISKLVAGNDAAQPQLLLDKRSKVFADNLQEATDKIKDLLNSLKGFVESHSAN